MYTEEFKIKNVIPGTHHINFTVSEDSNFTTGNVTITYMVVVYSNMESSYSVSDGSEADFIEFNLEDMIVVKNSDIKVCVVGTGGAFTTSSSQADMVNAFADRSITCKRVVCYDVTHGGVNAALNYCKEVYPSASEWDIYIVGKVMANNTYSSANGFVDISSSDYAGKTINLIGLTDNAKDILDANSKCRVLNLSVNAEVKIETLTLTKGATTDNGGGIAITNGTVKLGDASIVTGNYAKNGGGVYVASSGTLFMFARALIGDSATRTTAPTGYTDAANYCTGDKGGGIYNAGGNVYLGYSNYASSAENEECEITDGFGVIGNSDQTGGWGGGIYSTSSAITIINSGDVSFNHCINWGGGIYGPVTITGGRIRGNTAKTGGGIYINDGSSTMSAGEIGTKEAPNTAETSGGGVYVSNGASFTMTGGKISFNTAGVGGGVNIYWYSASSYGTFTFQGGTISGNEAAKEGGAIYNKGTLNLEGGTIGIAAEGDDWNKATGSNGKGGAIYQGGTCTMKGDIYIPFGYKEKINDVYIVKDDTTSYPIKLTGDLTNTNLTVATITPAYDSPSFSATQSVLIQDSTEYISGNCGKFNVVQRGNRGWYNIRSEGTNKGYVFADNSYYVQVEGDPNVDTITGSHIFVAGRDIAIPLMYAGVTELRQSEYEKYCFYKINNPDTNKNCPPNSNYSGTGFTEPVFYPAYGICIYDMFVYCNLRSLAEGLEPVYKMGDETDPRKWSGVSSASGKYAGPASVSDTWDEITMDPAKNGWRLPTEVEWEYLAMGGNSNTYVYSGSNNVADIAWYKENTLKTDDPNSSDGCSRPCRQKTANGYGLYDMSGNVCEMCWDWYTQCGTKPAELYDVDDSLNAYGCSKGQAFKDAEGSYANIPRRIVRGGPMNYPGDYQKITDRSIGNTSTMRWNNCGARIVRTHVEP